MKLLKSLLFTVVISVYSLPLLAQFQSNDFDKSLFYKDINAKVIFKNGDVQDVNTFYHPLFMVDPSVPLGDWEPISKKEIPGIPKEELKAIFIDGNLWVPRSTPLGELWVIIKIQGAIEYYVYPNAPKGKIDVIEEKVNRDVATNYQPKDITIIMASAVKKLNSAPVSQTQMMNFAKKMGEMTSDFKELSDKVASKESGYKFGSMTSIIREYNEWYDTEHPGKALRIDGKEWGVSGDPTGVTLKEGMASLADKKAQAKEKYENKKASRPATPPAQIASAKPNVPVKKESFTDKINRIKADGNKVGVQFVNPYVYIKPPANASSTMGSGIGGLSGGMLSDNKAISNHPKDTLVAYTELKELALSFVKDLNTAFDTDAFELIKDVNQIPYRKVMGSYLIDDWWATKYKLLMIYNIDTYYELSKQAETYRGDFRVTSHLTATEFFLKKGKPSQKSIVSLAAMGNYHKTLKESADHNIKTIADIEDHMAGTVMGSEIYETLLRERKSSFDKFVSKKKK